MVKKLLLFTILLLSACTSIQPIKEEIHEKLVPIYVVPKPPLVKKPELEIDKLSESDKKNVNIVSKALVISFQQLLGYSGDLELVYNKYNELSNTSVTIDHFDKKTPALLNIDKLKEFLDNH